jgi:hypothetical protein
MNGSGIEAGRCPFAATLLRKDFGCDRAIEVVRRGGPEVGCTDTVACRRCERLFDALKAVALPALGYEDDLATTPHSVFVKIQFGGLLGLQRLLGREVPEIENVRILVEESEEPVGRPEAMAAVVADIEAWRPRRRR